MTDYRGDDRRGRPAAPPRDRSTETAGPEPWPLSTILAAIWICGACGMAVAHAVRIRRFARVIRDSEPAPPAIRTMAARLSSRLGL